jgi:hypothetical protein
MWPIDVDALEFFIGSPVDLNIFIDRVNADREEGSPRIERYGKDKLWITGFCAFQYGELSSMCKPHINVISKLNKYGLLHRVPVRVSDRVLDTLQEKEKDKEEEKEKEKDNTGKKIQKALTFAENDAKADKVKYETEIAPTLQEIDNVTAKTKVADFIREKKPGFIEPYIHLWNLSAIGNGLSQAKDITDSRKRKFKTRIKESSFDFLKILAEIRQSNYLRGHVTGWKVDFDWVFENDSNYINILEGKYRNAQN